MAAALDVLLVSNGYGEAAISGYIARAIAAKAPQARIEHLALVGRAPPDAWPARVGPSADLPSGGLVANWHLRNLARDIGAGLVRLTLRQYGYLREQRGRSVIVAVGDVFCLAMSLAARRPTVFVATAKSDFVSPHSALERSIVRKATVTFARDAHTAATLAQKGIQARYAGNVMMDGIAPGGLDLASDPAALRLAILPGSRSDAPRQAAAMIERLQAVARRTASAGKRVQAYVSVAPSSDAAAIAAALRESGVNLREVTTNPGIIARADNGILQTLLVKDAFGDLLDAAQVVLGQAGTANEQAAGYARPVVAVLEPTEQPGKMQWYRMRQKRLLGDALAVFPSAPEEFAGELLALLADPVRLETMARAGRERMGGPGGAAAVADTVIALAAEPA